MIDQIAQAFEVNKHRTGDTVKFEPEIKVKRDNDTLYISEIRKTKVNYMALVGEFVMPGKLKTIGDVEVPLLQEFHVSGFSISEKSEGVIITAQRTLSSGKTMGFNTPLVVFSDDSENSYKFSKELEIVVAECRDEFELYLGGKFKDDSQGKLFAE